MSSASLARFVSRASRAVRLRGTVDVLLTGSRELRALNRRFRGKDKPTDVLSFPALKSKRAPRPVAGELAISLDIAKINAGKLGHPVEEEIKILVLHGILHLAGFDHECDDGEMAMEEIRLRRRLKLDPGLIERVRVRRSPSTKLKSRRQKSVVRRSTA